MSSWEKAGFAGAMFGAAALGVGSAAIGEAALAYYSSLTYAQWSALPAMGKVFYEIGHKTLRNQQFRLLPKFAGNACQQAVARGQYLVATQGWLRAVWPQFVSGNWSTTIGTGVTPGTWWATETFVAGSAGVGLGYWIGSQSRP